MAKRQFRRKRTHEQIVRAMYPLHLVTNIRFWKTRLIPRHRGSSWARWFKERLKGNV